MNGTSIINAASNTGANAATPASTTYGNYFNVPTTKSEMQGRDNLKTGIELLNAVYNQGIAPGYARAREQAATTIAEQMQSRNIRGSGIHADAITEAMARLNAEEYEAANKAALEVYSVLDESTQKQLDRDLQLEMLKMQMEQEQSLANQSKRSNIVSGILGFGAAAIGKGKLF